MFGPNFCDTARICLGKISLEESSLVRIRGGEIILIAILSKLEVFQLYNCPDYVKIEILTPSLLSLSLT